MDYPSIQHLYSSNPELSYSSCLQGKRSKSKNKVWEKVAWFTRKSSRNGREIEMDAATADQNKAALPSMMDLSPIDTPANYPLGLGGSTEASSSSDEFFEINTIRKSCLYPNSEIDEQSCLKPSVARALFHRMELASVHGKPKFARPKKKRIMSLPNGFDGTQSMLNGMNFNSNSAIENSFQTQNKQLNYESTQYSPSYNKPTHKAWKSPKSQKYKHHRNLKDSNDLTEKSSNGTNDSNNRNPNKYHSPSQTRSRKLKYNEHLFYYESELDKDAILNFNKFKYHSLPSEFSFPHKSYLDQQTHCDCVNSSHGQGSLKCKHHFHGTPKAKHLSICDDWYYCSVSAPNICDCKLPRGSTELHEPIVQKQTDVKEAKVISCTKEDKVSPVSFKERNDDIQKWFSEFNDEQKNQVLTQLLDKCGLPQIHLLSINMDGRLHRGCPPNCQDMITWLPKTISLYVFSFLDPASLCQASVVCKSWNELSDEPCLWRNLCLMTTWRLSIAGEHKQIINHMLPNGDIHWKRVFGERFRLRNNWLKGKCHIRTFEGHTQGVSCVQFDDTRIVSGSTDKTIRVWNIRTNTPWLVQTLAGHSGTVRCLHLDGNRLVSGSEDQTIKVWDLSMQQSWSSIACKVTMVGHTDTVRCLQVDDEKVISGSYDKTLKIWDIRTGYCKQTLRGHDGSVLCVQFDEHKIVSGSADRTILIWSFEGRCLMRYKGHQDAVTCLQFDSTRIMSGSLDCTLKFWDINVGQCIKTIDWKASEGHTRVVRDLQADKWKLVSASDDRTIKVWSLDTGQRLVTLRNHTDGVTCVQFNDNFIVSGSYDKSVKLWDFSCC